MNDLPRVGVWQRNEFERSGSLVRCPTYRTTMPHVIVSRITPLLRDLHWLRVPERIPYWLCKVPLQRCAWQCHLNKYIFNNNNNNNSGWTVENTGQEQPPEPKSTDRPGHDVPRRRSSSRSGSVDDGEFASLHQLSPPIPAVKHRRGSDRSDVESRRTARAPGREMRCYFTVMAAELCDIYC